jgi:hypothetical protein
LNYQKFRIIKKAQFNYPKRINNYYGIKMKIKSIFL